MNKIEPVVDSFNKGVVKQVNIIKNNGIIKMLISFVTIVTIIYVIYKTYNFIIEKAQNEPFILKGYHNATKPYIYNKSLPKSQAGNGFSMIFWMYVGDWGYKQSKAKHVLHIGSEDGHSVCPGVWLYPENNNLLISIDDHSRNINSPSMNPEVNSSVLKETKPCDIIDIPVQRWLQIGIVLNNKTIDIYLNSKLRRSCTLENVPKLTPGGLYLTQWGGFKGFLSDVQYISRPISTWEMYRIYRGTSDRLDVNNLIAGSLNTVIPKVNFNVDFDIELDNGEDVTVENFV